MPVTKWLGWLMLCLTVAVGLWRGAAPAATSLPPTPTRMVWYAGAFPQGGAFGVIPTRGGRKGEDWDLTDVIVTGSRSPLSPDAPRLAKPERVTIVPQPTLQERILVIEATKRPLARVLLLGEGVPEGLLTSPSTRFTAGVLAATDLATLATGQNWGAGRMRATPAPVDGPARPPNALPYCCNQRCPVRASNREPKCR